MRISRRKGSKLCWWRGNKSNKKRFKHRKTKNKKKFVFKRRPSWKSLIRRRRQNARRKKPKLREIRMLNSKSRNKSRKIRSWLPKKMRRTCLMLIQVIRKSRFHLKTMVVRKRLWKRRNKWARKGSFLIKVLKIHKRNRSLRSNKKESLLQKSKNILTGTPKTKMLKCWNKKWVLRTLNQSQKCLNQFKKRLWHKTRARAKTRWGEAS